MKIICDLKYSLWRVFFFFFKLSLNKMRSLSLLRNLFLVYTVNNVNFAAASPLYILRLCAARSGLASRVALL